MILVAGSGNLDLVIRVPHLPRHGETVLGGGLDICDSPMRLPALSAP